MGESFFVALIVDLVKNCIDFVEIGFFLLTEFVNPFFVDDVKRVVGGG